MGWAKFDDRWATHPKLLAAGLEAKGLDASGICYSAGLESDGFIADSALAILAAGSRKPHGVAQRLVTVGRWSRDDEMGGYWIHDYHDYNPSREEAELKRAAERERKASGRKTQGRDRHGRVTSGRTPEGNDADSRRSPHGRDSDSARIPEGVPPVPTRPDPYPSPASPTTSDISERNSVNGEMKTKSEVNPNSDPLLDRLAGVWSGRDRRRECATVLAQLRPHFDDAFIDEAVGHMLAKAVPPAAPAYLRALLADWAKQRGVYAPGDEAIKVLSTPSDAILGKMD